MLAGSLFCQRLGVSSFRQALCRPKILQENKCTYMYIYIQSVSGMGDGNRPVPLAPLALLAPLAPLAPIDQTRLYYTLLYSTLLYSTLLYYTILY